MDQFADNGFCERWLRVRESERDAGTLKKPSRKTVTEYLPTYLATVENLKRRKARTVADNEAVANRYIVPVFGHLRLVALSTAHDPGLVGGPLRPWPRGR